MLSQHGGSDAALAVRSAMGTAAGVGIVATSGFVSGDSASGKMPKPENGGGDCDADSDEVRLDMACSSADGGGAETGCADAHGAGVFCGADGISGELGTLARPIGDAATDGGPTGLIGSGAGEAG